MSIVKATVVELPVNQYQKRRDELTNEWWKFCEKSPVIPTFREYVIQHYESEFEYLFQDGSTRSLKPPQ